MMKRLLKTYKALATAAMPIIKYSVHSAPYSLFNRKLTTLQTPPTSSLPSTADIVLFPEKFRNVDSKGKQNYGDKVSVLRDELLLGKDDVVKVEQVLMEKGVPLFRRYSDGSALIQLLMQLDTTPHLALEVLNWRRRQVDDSAPMTSEEYAKGIILAGKLKNVDLAVELFAEAGNRQLKTTSVYNALMSAYMFNGFSVKCQSLFRDLKREATCSPTIVTYNILLSLFGRLMLIDHMEATLGEIKDLNLSPNVSTYNNLIAGYVTAWMWNSMEKTFQAMQATSVKPDLTTFKLLLRGYAHSGQLNKMEQMYELLRDHRNLIEFPMIRSMICAYCRSSDVNRVKKVEDLLMLLPEHEYRPWLNVLLICLYANEDMLEGMENLINQAFECNTYVTAVSVMKCISCSYFRLNAVDRLADFIKRAESAGWKICRSLYHCKMVMYAAQRRLTEMESVLDEMDRVNISCSKRTLWILHKAYSKWGEKSKLDQVVGMICKYGYDIPLDASSLQFT